MKKVGHSFGKLNFFLYIYYVINNQLTLNIMNFIRFDRHELFNQDWMDYHSYTIRMVEDFYIGNDESWFNDLYNKLCGVWDGYLYTDMLESAKQMGLPTHLLQRIANTLRFIESNQK